MTPFCNLFIERPSSNVIKFKIIARTHRRMYRHIQDRLLCFGQVTWSANYC